MLSRSNVNGAPGILHRPVVTARGGERGVTYRSGNAQVQYWIGADIPIEFNAERLMSAYHAWSAAAAAGLPRLSEIIDSDARVAANDHLLFLRIQDDYLVVSQGNDHMLHIGQDMRGHMLSEFQTPIATVIKDLHDQCLADKQAIYVRFVSDLATESVYWEGLKLPLRADDAGQAHMIMNYSIPIDNKTDILQMVLDRAPVGMIAAVPLGETRGSVDGRIIMINSRAKELLKFDEKGSRVHYIRELAPWLRDVSGWTRTGITTQGEKTCISYRNKSQQNFSVTMEALKRFVLFSIAEIPGADRPNSSDAEA
jgi:hypothetical protein